LIADSEGTPLLLHNEVAKPATAHWVGFALSQPPGAPGGRDAYGAVVTVRAGGRTLMRHCHADGSYMSRSDTRVHFGLGSGEAIESITVRWPDGKSETWPGSGNNNPGSAVLPTDRYHRLERGTGFLADTRISMGAPAPRPGR